MTLAEQTEPPPAPGPPVGYAPSLCSHGPTHYARRDPETVGQVVWKCANCGLKWRTDGQESS